MNRLLIDRQSTTRARFTLMLSAKNLRSRSPKSVARKRIQLERIAKAVLFVALGFATSCGGSLYRVKPVAELSNMPASAATANLGSVSFRAAPLLTDEETQELFESNLQLAGLLPVRIEIVHNSGEAIELKKVRLNLRDAAGVEWKSISAKDAIGRILKANKVFAYNPVSRKAFEKEFRAYELDLKSPLTNAERRRHGLVIFLSPKKEPVASPHGLVLSINGLSQPATLNLN